MKESARLDPAAPCCECGSNDTCIAYSAPVFVYAKNSVVSRAVIADESVTFEGVIECCECERSWTLDHEPQLGDWSAWELGC